MRSWLFGLATTTALATTALASMTGTAGAETTITLWSHWADHETKVAFVEQAAKNFEAKHPDAKVEITWYQKNPLYAALKTALRAGEAPDVFYSEPNQVEYIENGFLLPLDDHIDWDNVEPWAREVWTFDGKTYGLPLETFTVELYYDRDKMAELGIELPDDGQVDQATFKDIVAKAAEAGVTPIVQGVGDRPYPGAYLTHELLLKKLGKDDYQKLLDGALSFEDERVQEVFSYVRELVELGAYPESFTTLKLGESHYYFHTNPGGLRWCRRCGGNSRVA